MNALFGSVSCRPLPVKYHSQPPLKPELLQFGLPGTVVFFSLIRSAIA